MNFKRLCDKIKWLNLDEALWILSVLQAEQVFICHKGAWKEVKNLALTYALTALIDFIPIKFWGGPIASLREREGSLAMFVVDRILATNESRGIEWKWLLRYDRAAGVHIRKQLEHFIPKSIGPSHVVVKRVGRENPPRDMTTSKLDCHNSRSLVCVS